MTPMKHFALAALGIAAAARLAAFEVSPLIFPADSEATVTIRAVNDAEKKILAEEPLFYLSDRRTWTDGTPRMAGRPMWQRILPKRGDGEVTVSLRLCGEGWHNLRFGRRSAKGDFIQGKFTNLMVYSLKPDLFAMRPWKGDIHQHSIRCGHAKLEPKVIPAYNRRAGFDFMALSEHRRHKPSLEAIEAAKPWNCGLVLFTGEEFHSPGDMLHSVAVGHTAGINDWHSANRAEFDRRVAEELKKPVYDRYEMDEYTKKQAAMATVYYRIAREQGAKVIAFSHPTDFISFNKVEEPPESYRRFMLENADYDALELPNTSTNPFSSLARADRLMLMNAHWMELARARRKVPPVVAASDNHDQRQKWFGQTFTVFFAPKCDLENFAAAVKDRRSLGVRNVGQKTYLIFGASRLMKFQQFLEVCYWPEHDKLCRKQGELLLELAEKGDTSVLPEVEKLAKEIDDYRESRFAPAK